MAKNRVMTTGDTKPDLKLILSASDPVQAESAQSIRIIGVMKKSGVEKFDRAPTAVQNLPDDTSLVTLELVPTDTETPGILEVEVEVTWAPGVIQTFPGVNEIDLHLALG